MGIECLANWVTIIGFIIGFPIAVISLRIAYKSLKSQMKKYENKIDILDLKLEYQLQVIKISYNITNTFSSYLEIRNEYERSVEEETENE